MRFFKSLLAGACAFGLFVGIAKAEPVKIRVSYVVPVANWAPMIEAKKELARHLGKSYTLEAIRFAGTPALITALANNELEVADLTYPTLPLAIRNLTSGRFSSDTAGMLAATSLAMLPAIGFFSLFERRIVGGLTGAVKG